MKVEEKLGVTGLLGALQMRKLMVVVLDGGIGGDGGLWWCWREKLGAKVMGEGGGDREQGW
ncbi:nucleolar protein 6-like [Pyrus ussuriensis x Pyrus communis]|uniref:Nucleolar protein 6-like n=1 Tax=Pyrus ussuriensis x Pyrus communis TaxID=2448454 RepID=A0A5N5GCR2_9ROSA|nr:nucleolar protein 6-like [Pyrus ussuriensis x Pyrus communis]